MVLADIPSGSLNKKMLKMPFTGGLPETGCGVGSMLATTSGVRSWLPQLLAEFEVETLLDAPCGDFNWMARTDLSGVNYLGCDYDAKHCQMAAIRESEPRRFRPRSKKVVEFDLCKDELLDCADLMLCRDFLQHLPNLEVAAVLRNFIGSGIPLLLATSHNNADNKDIAAPGMFRALNLTAAPFNLPAPQQSITDNGRILGLWHRDEIMTDGKM